MDGRKEQLALIEQLRAIDDPSARVAADELQDIYHAREMAALSADVYDAARGEGDPPNGWLRASEISTCSASATQRRRMNNCWQDSSQATPVSGRRSTSPTRMCSDPASNRLWRSRARQEKSLAPTAPDVIRRLKISLGTTFLNPLGCRRTTTIRQWTSRFC